MSLKNDFHVADAHTAAYQTLTRYITHCRELSNSKSATSILEHAPKTVIKDRTFLQIVLDDALDAFSTVMARTMHDSDITFDDVPHEFFLKLMRDRHGPKISKQEGRDTLEKVINFKLSRPALIYNPELPTFIKLVMDEFEPQALADLANNWNKVINGFSTLMMSNSALAAHASALEMQKTTVSTVQGHINKTMENRKLLGGPAGASGGNPRNLEDLLKKLEGKTLPPEVREKVNDEIEKLGDGRGSEAEKVKDFLKWIAALPWNEFSKLETDINKADQTLEKDHYGLTKVKSRIIEHVAVENHKGNSTGRILCLVGPPGVGKTSIAESIARATGRAYARLSLGGVRDEAAIRGHSRTYVGSRPGRMMETMKKAGTSNPLIVLDEIDKMGHESVNGDPSAAMLEVLDPAQNNTFHDHFMELDYDLSKVMFIATANDLGSIPGPLRDRMDVIMIPGYTREEKLEIAKRHLVVKRMAENKLTSDQLEISDDAILKLINDYTREAGVRSLERSIDTVCRKTVLGLQKGEIKGKIVVTAANLETFSGPTRVRHTDVKVNGDRVGVVNGLAWSAVGGSILQIEAMKGPGADFKLEVTGHLGEVMKESSAVARRVVISMVDQLGLKKDALKKMEVHVHALDGAVPKDGPSAGAAMTTAIISAVTDIPIRSNVAMTGEISLNGEIMPIGGLPEKLDGALQDGADTVIIPKANEADLEDVPASIRSKLKIILASRIEEVLAVALTRPLPGMLVKPANDTSAPALEKMAARRGMKLG